MKIVVINGTEVKGCTYHIKEKFLFELRNKNEIVEFYLPKDLPHFCCGCKICFLKDEKLCPHSKWTMPIWNAIIAADLIVFAAPVYALRVPAQVKSLLDHLCCHWMAHRPDSAMFTKRAVVITNSIGAPNGAAQKDIVTSLNWLGVSQVHRIGFGLMEGVVWDELSVKRRQRIEQKTKKFAQKLTQLRAARKGIKVRAYFFMCRLIHKGVLKNEVTPSADNQHWIDNGWI